MGFFIHPKDRVIFFIFHGDQGALKGQYLNINFNGQHLGYLIDNIHPQPLGNGFAILLYKLANTGEVRRYKLKGHLLLLGIWTIQNN